MIRGSARGRRGSPARSGDFMESRRLGGSGRDALLRVRPTGNRHDVAAAGGGEAGELRACNGEGVGGRADLSTPDIVCIIPAF